MPHSNIYEKDASPFGATRPTDARKLWIIQMASPRQSEQYVSRPEPREATTGFGSDRSFQKPAQIRTTTAELPERNQKTNRTCCGMSLRIFVPILVVFIIGLAIGVIFALVKALSSPASSKPTLTSNSGLAVTGQFTDENTKWNMQLFYQDPSNIIHFRINSNTSLWQTEQTPSLSVGPSSQVPMAATSYAANDDTVFLQLFYVTHGDIALANITCRDATPASCSVLSNTIVSSNSNLKFPVAESSSIAAVYVPSFGWKVFYHNTDMAVTQLAFKDGVWDKGTVIAGQATVGSSLAAVSFSSTNDVEVIYSDKASQQIYTVEEVDGEWQTPKPISSISNQVFTPLSPITIAYSSTHDSLLAFFTGSSITTTANSTSTTLSSEPALYQHTGRNASDPSFPTAVSSAESGISDVGWTQQAVHDKTWADANTFAGLSAGTEALIELNVQAVGWGDQVRFFEMVKGNLVETSGNLTSGTWSVNRIL